MFEFKEGRKQVTKYLQINLKDYNLKDIKLKVEMKLEFSKEEGD